MRVSEESDICGRILSVMEGLCHIKDLDSLLDTLLMQARCLTHADAGSIYLIEDQALHFSYLQNDTLFPTSGSNKYLYTSQVVEINNRSLAGYVALTGTPLMIEDAYNLPTSLPFSFNEIFDRLSGYRTKSILAVPLTTSQKMIVGVLQLINALNDKGEFIPFTAQDQLLLSYFANNAAAAVERARMTRKIILRMIKMCELRDPGETGPHVSRVATYAAEIYQQWSLARGIPREEIKKTKDLIRIAAMLHDLGKIAISDLILNKPRQLDPEEFRLMQWHTIYGARLFGQGDSELDLLSAEIALNHHEWWDGTGYPGKIPDIFRDDVALGPGKQGEEIPLGARIVALADVYDALVSKRVYKPPMPEDQALEYIRAQSGRQFDPEVVAAFLAVHEVIVAIREKYQEELSIPLVAA
jgi:HD-GYP domain-containing protein (c-di-GMP phosphodiesterase class II)